ncbi:MAG: DUF2971 domain-containing protein [Puniceicoccaceae bacterium]|nr:DUF2971 domain-containing protein [Puniceicoccaceae bacterium]
MNANSENSQSKVLRLFRFRAINEYLWQELEMAEIFACKPQLLNDPFDCQVDPISALSRALEKTEDPERAIVLNHIKASFLASDPRANDVGLSCFSLSMENQLMWTHYADSHRGVCLCYDIPEAHFRTHYPTTNQDHYLVGIADIKYGNDSYFSWLLEGDFHNPVPSEPTTNAAAQTLVSKAACWAYEQEVRIIMNRPGFFRLDPGFLTQVTFGLRTPKRQKELIAQMAKRSNPSVKLAVTRRSKEADFGILFDEIGG